MNEKPTGLKRLVKAAGYSCNGLMYSAQHEEAFRLELIIAFIFIPLAFWMDVTHVERILLVGSILLLMIVELLNTAVEACVDRIGLEMHELSGAAKDIASAAVLIASFFVLVTWGSIVYESYNLSAYLPF